MNKNSTTTATNTHFSACFGLEFEILRALVALGIVTPQQNRSMRGMLKSSDAWAPLAVAAFLSHYGTFGVEWEHCHSCGSAFRPSFDLQVVWLAWRVTLWQDGMESRSLLGAFGSYEEASREAGGAIDWPQDNVEMSTGDVTVAKGGYVTHATSQDLMGNLANLPKGARIVDSSVFGEESDYAVVVHDGGVFLHSVAATNIGAKHAMLEALRASSKK